MPKSDIKGRKYPLKSLWFIHFCVLAIWYTNSIKDYTGTVVHGYVWVRDTVSNSLWSPMCPPASAIGQWWTGILGILDDSFLIAFLSTQFPMIDRLFPSWWLLIWQMAATFFCTIRRSKQICPVRGSLMSSKVPRDIAPFGRNWNNESSGLAA